MSNTDFKGATSPGNPALYPASAGELAARWNLMGFEARNEFVALMVANAQRAHDCWALQHCPEDVVRAREARAWEAGRREGLAEAAERGA